VSNTDRQIAERAAGNVIRAAVQRARHDDRLYADIQSELALSGVITDERFEVALERAMSATVSVYWADGEPAADSGPSGAQALRDFADLIDRGPTFPLPPSIFSEMARERAADLEPARSYRDNQEPTSG